MEKHDAEKPRLGLVVLGFSQGEENDPESGRAPATHVAWNALARLDLALRRTEK